MRKLLLLLLILFSFASVTDAQVLPNLPAIRAGIGGIVNPSILWDQPSTETVITTSVREQFFAGTATPGSAALVAGSVSVICTGATTIDSDATGTETWRYPAASTVTLAVGVTNCVITVSDENGRTAQTSKQFSIISPDDDAPTVDAGADASTSASTFSRTVDCVDDVECVSVTWSGLGGTDVACTLQGSGATRTANCVFTLVATGELTTANTITVTGLDIADNSGQDQVIITRTVALAITTSSIGDCIEDVSCTKPALQATGGTTGTYTFDNNGAGTTLNDSDADCTGLSIASNGVISGTPNPASVPATCSFTARVNDTQTTATKPFTITIQSATAEQRHSYFEFQINKTDEGSASSTSSGRQKCAADNTGTDCILQFDDCPDATYGDNGACRFSEDKTAPITMTAALAKAQIASMQPGTSLDREMGTKQNFTIGYDTDPYANKQLGAKVIIVGDIDGDGLCDQNPPGSGCPGLRGSENLEMTFANITIGGGPTGTVTFVAEEFYSPAWNSNGINGGGTDVVSDCPGGELGTRNMRKTYRIDTVGKAIWLAWKTDFRQANSQQYFYEGAGDNKGFWDCDDNVVAVSTTTGQNSEKNAFASTLVSPRTLGIVDYDGGTKPNGKGGFGLTSNSYDFPIMHSRWTRRILHIEYGVPANSSKFNDWRDDCDQRDRAKPLNSFEPGAANDQSAVNGTADFKCAGMLTNDPATAQDAGPCPTALTDLSLCSIADQDNRCDTIDEAGCPSLWALVSSWICDEVRGCRRAIWRVPWWQVSPDDGVALAMKLFQVEYDSSTSSCEQCGDAIFYQGPIFGIVNIDPNDIDDTGCPSACIGDNGGAGLVNNLFRKPKSLVQ